MWTTHKISNIIGEGSTLSYEEKAKEAILGADVCCAPCIDRLQASSVPVPKKNVCNRIIVRADQLESVSFVFSLLYSTTFVQQVNGHLS